MLASGPDTALYACRTCKLPFTIGYISSSKRDGTAWRTADFCHRPDDALRRAGRGVAAAKLNPSWWLYRAACRSRDLEAVASGDPRRMARRAKNKVLGAGLTRLFRA